MEDTAQRERLATLRSLSSYILTFLSTLEVSKVKVLESEMLRLQEDTVMSVMTIQLILPLRVLPTTLPLDEVTNSYYNGLREEYVQCTEQGVLTNRLDIIVMVNSVGTMYANFNTFGMKHLDPVITLPPYLASVPILSLDSLYQVLHTIKEYYSHFNSQDYELQAAYKNDDITLMSVFLTTLSLSRLLASVSFTPKTIVYEFRDKGTISKHSVQLVGSLTQKLNVLTEHMLYKGISNFE